jgi:hypothetical protein
MFLKLWIGLKLFWKEFKTGFYIFFGFILWTIFFVMAIFIPVELMGNFSKTARVITSSTCILFLAFGTWFGFFCGEKSFEIDRKYNEVIKTKEKRKAEKGMLSKVDDFEENMEGTLQYADDVEKKHVGNFGHLSK